VASHGFPSLPFLRDKWKLPLKLPNKATKGHPKAAFPSLIARLPSSTGQVQLDPSEAIENTESSLNGILDRKKISSQITAFKYDTIPRGCVVYESDENIFSMFQQKDKRAMLSHVLCILPQKITLQIETGRQRDPKENWREETHRSFYTHTGAFTQRSLCKELFTHRRFYTEKS
jgi:hypothetical protein